MEKRISTWVSIVTSILGLLVGTGWYQEHHNAVQARAEQNAKLIADDLQPIATLLKMNQGIVRQLRSAQYSEPGWGIQESYLIKIKRDGVPKNAVMKNQIDTLVANDAEIIALLKYYSGYVITPDFKAESTNFIDHAVRYRGRWNALLEVFAAKGDFPTAEPVFPEAFPEALQKEIAARSSDSR